MTRPRVTTVVRAIAARWRWLALVSIAAAAVGLWAATRPAPPPSYERWGVDQLRIRRTAAGYLLDLRYQVVDPTRAGSLLSEESTAYLVHERSGARLPVPTTPKTGALRTTGVPQAGRSYFALFANPGGLVQRGDRVSIVLGDLATDLTVE